ncbi:uncharacterized protein LOC126745779 isoform X2 [Anthonomus grandis grandis]|uniref:uncharacterized protein LOC126745779 isoform X2 n=1 Tax=Anthonomus grandis grandis TaxID=2921223 RepID=UPI002165F311|nr:uncharacterized protein LOC126745779 isoform X2 [Anthonomus grandis grandis]
MPKRVVKLAEKRISRKDINCVETETGTKPEPEKKKKTKPEQSNDGNAPSSKMTLCTQPMVNASGRPQRRPGRPPGAGKKMLSRDMPGKLRSAYRRSLDPCDNSNDSGFDHHADPHHHTMSMSERLNWTGERLEPKRLRVDIKVENEDVNDNYCFPSTVQCKDNISLIRTAPSGTIPALDISSTSSATSGRAVPRCTPITSKQTPTASIPLTTQLTATSRFSDVSLTIVKQPEQQHRARYQTEGSRGAVKDRDGNGFPIVQLTGYYKPAVLQVYIGTDVGKVAPHMFYQACKVSGKNSTPCVEKKIEGTCVIELGLDPSKDMCATCDCVGILKERNVDVEHRFPDQLGNRSKKKSTRCRMIFRTTISHDNGTTETLQVCSQPIVCTQPPGIPEICKKSLTSCPASGGLELFVLGKNFLKDTKVFFQQFEDGQVCWEQSVVPDKEYLQQTHFVCVVPPYRRPNITEPVQVRLCVVSSGKTSESHQFVYTPVNGTVSVYADAHAQHAPSFKGAIWNSGHFSKRQQDVDMMPPPDSNLVPLSTRRSSVSLPSTSELHSPPLNSLKQEYFDENSEGSLPEAIDVHRERYRPISESSLDVNHDSNISMINDNSVDLMHHDSMMSQISENSNLSIKDESLGLVRRNSMSLSCDNAIMNEENSCANVTHPIVNERAVPQLQAPVMSTMEKVMDLRMKLPINGQVNDFTANASMATLKHFGIEPSSAPLPPQSAQSVANYLTKIESKSNLLALGNNNACPIIKGNINKDIMSAQSLPIMMESAPQNMASSVFLTSQQPFLSEASAISTMAKSEAAAIAEQVITGTSTISNTTLTTSLEGSISTPMNSEKLDEILNSTLESHMGSPPKPVTVIAATQDVILNSDASIIASPVLNANLASPLLGSAESHSSAALSPEAILNSQLSPSLMCGNTSAVSQEPLIGSSRLSVMGTTAGDSSLLQSSITATVTTQESALLNVEPEKAVLLEAAVDFLKTQKKINELTTSPQNIMSMSPSASEMTTASQTIMGITSSSTETSGMGLDTTIGSYMSPYSTIPTPSNAPSIMGPKSTIADTKNYLPPNLKDIGSTDAQNLDKKNADRMIPQGFASLTENELINLINPTCFDQGNNYHH